MRVTPRARDQIDTCSNLAKISPRSYDSAGDYPSSYPDAAKVESRLRLTWNG
jgi:hypothetical protein